MKIRAILFLILIFGLPHSSFSQETYGNNFYEGIFSNIYLNHHPNIRAEAMGRGLSSSDNGDYAPLYNPALSSLTKGVKVNYSYSQQESEKPSLNYYEASYSNQKIGSIGLSAYYYSKNPLSGWFIEMQNHKSYYDALYTINYAREVSKDFFAGVNFNVFHYSHIYESWIGSDYLIFEDGFSFDAGVLKKFELSKEQGTQIAEVSAAFYNFTNSKYTHDSYGYTYKSPLPSILRIGGSYLFKADTETLNGKFYPVTSFTHIEFEKVVNSNLGIFVKVGQEITLHEVLSLRAGMFFINRKDNDVYAVSDFNSSQFYWGGGINFPFHKFFNLKKDFTLKIDYAKTDFSGYINPYGYREYYSTGIYNSLGLSLNYGL